MIHPRFFYFVSNASLAVVLGFAPLVGHAQPPLDFSGALPGGLSAGLITTPAPEVAALTLPQSVREEEKKELPIVQVNIQILGPDVPGFGSFPDTILTYLCTHFSEDERCSRTRRISKSFDKAVTQTLRLQYPLEEMIHAIPRSLRSQATTRDSVNHAMAPLRAIQLIEDYQGISRSTNGFEQKFPDKPEKEILIQKLGHLALQLYEESYPQQFILALISWIEQGATQEVGEELRRLVLKFQGQIKLSKMPLTYDLLAFCQLRGIGMQKETDFEKNTFFKPLRKFKKESKLSQKILPLIRSLKLNDYLTLKAQLWPMVTKVKDFKPKVDLLPLTETQLESFQILVETNFLDSHEAFACALFFHNQEDFQKAFLFFKHSARLGNSVAQFNTALTYHQGEGIPVNEDIALYYYQLAASQNCAGAYWNMGLIFQRCKWQGDHDVALHHFSKAAELYHGGKKQSDYLEVLAQMASLHLWGHLTSPDPELAISCLHQAKEGKNANAYLCLAECYQSGLGVEKNLETAFDYLDKATAEGTDKQKTLAEQKRKIWIKEREEELKNASDIETEFTLPIFHKATQ